MTENAGKKESLQQMDLVLQEKMSMNRKYLWAFPSLLGRILSITVCYLWAQTIHLVL